MKSIFETTERGAQRLADHQLRRERWLAEQIERGDAPAKGECEDASGRCDEDNPFENFRPIDFEPPAQESGNENEAPEGEDLFGDGDGEHYSPMGSSNEGDPGADRDEDTEMRLLEPMMRLFNDEEQKEVIEAEKEIMNLVRGFGGNRRKYKREQKKASNTIVSEVFSRPRVTKAAKMMPSYGIVPGLAMDLTTGWDFDLREHREEARRTFDEQRPMFLIGSPACTAFSTWQKLNEQRCDPEKMRREYVRAMVHLKFVCELYESQVLAGRYFVHEHPANASSWGTAEVAKAMNLPDVRRVVGDQCQMGQETAKLEPIKKPTGWASNSEEVRKVLQARCLGKGGQCSRNGGGIHRTCCGGLARRAAVYPMKLCRAILRGFRNQLRADGRLADGVAGIQTLEKEEVCLALCEGELKVMTDVPRENRGDRFITDVNELEEFLELHRVDQETFKDAVTGHPLRPAMVKEARRLELEYFATKGVWVKRPCEEAVQKMGKKPITVKWVDVNKGDDLEPNYRSRLVAREIRRPWEESIFAPTPPLESVRTILSAAATNLPGDVRHVRSIDSDMRTQVSFVDISRAYFNAKTDDEDPIYVALPDEDPDKQKGMCGMLLRHMYGTRRAAEGWYEEYSGVLQEMGFVKGSASACVFRHAERRLLTSVHGDDFTTMGPKKHLDWFVEKMKKHYELKESARLGPGTGDDQEARVLNRVVRWTRAGLEYEADPRQAEKLIHDLGLAGSRSTATPGIKQTLEQVENDKVLPIQQQRPYMAVGARGNYLAADRPDVQFAAKEICRWMSSPTESGLTALKRLGRFLEGHKRLVYQYPWQDAHMVDVHSDTDWAGCPRTRKSTSGGCLMLGRHLIKSWSSTQSQVSLSSAEAEYYGVVKASGMALGYSSLLEDLGYRLPLRVWTDSSATMGICGRQGLGKLRHIDTQCLWIQQRVRDGTIELRKVRGDSNPADLFTKHIVGNEKIKKLLNLFGCEYTAGRAESAPQLRKQEESGILATETVSIPPIQGPTIEVDGQLYPAIEVEGEMMAEAREYNGDVLPHLVDGDINALFPRAEACDELEDEEEALDDLLLRGEARWRTAKI